LDSYDNRRAAEEEVEGMDTLRALKGCRCLEGIHNVLTPIALALKFLEGDKYPTLSFVQLLGYILKIAIGKSLTDEEARATPDAMLVAGYKELLLQLQNRFSYAPLEDNPEYMPVDYLAAALDPRTKGLEFITERERLIVCYSDSLFP
jgi:hypothetical protein